MGEQAHEDKEVLNAQLQQQHSESDQEAAHVAHFIVPAPERQERVHKHRHTCEGPHSI